MGIANFTSGNGDQTWSNQNYKDAFMSMWNGFKSELKFDVNGDGKEITVDRIGLSPLWNVSKMGFVDFIKNPLEFNNGKYINYYMSASEEYSDVFMAVDDGRNWTNDASVKAYFDKVDISYEVQQTPVKKPTNFKEILSDGVHYYKI